MASIFPTQIDQINDFTSRAGDKVLSALGNKATFNPFDAVNITLGKAHRAMESQRLTEAVDAYNRAMESGKSASQALQGLDARITGSKAFKDEADKIRSSIIQQTAENRAQAMWANNLRNQRQQEEANWLVADYLKTVATTPNSDSLWLKDHEERLKANPIAYATIMQKLQGKDLYLPNADDVAAVTALVDDAPNTINKLKSAKKEAEAIIDNASNLGIAKSTDLEKSPYLTDLNSFIEHHGKLRDYTGRDMADFADSMRKAYNKLSSQYGNLPQEQLLATMERYLYTPWESGVPFFGSYRQDDIDIDRSLGALEKLAPNFSTQKEMIEKAIAVKNLMKDADNNEALQKELMAAQSQIARNNQQYKDGIIPTKERADRLNAMVAKALISKLSTLGLGTQEIKTWAAALAEQGAKTK